MGLVAWASFEQDAQASAGARRCVHDLGWDQPAALRAKNVTRAFDVGQIDGTEGSVAGQRQDRQGLVASPMAQSRVYAHGFESNVAGPGRHRSARLEGRRQPQDLFVRQFVAPRWRVRMLITRA